MSILRGGGGHKWNINNWPYSWDFPGGLLGRRASTAGGTGSISGQGTKIPQATQPKQNKNQNKKTIDQMASLCTLLETPIGLKLF